MRGAKAEPETYGLDRTSLYEVISIGSDFSLETTSCNNTMIRELARESGSIYGFKQGVEMLQQFRLRR